MGRMVNLSELQQRAKAVETQFLDTIKDTRNRSDRLSGLLNMIEERFVSQQAKIEDLKEANAQLEDKEVDRIGWALPALESRLEELVAMDSNAAGPPMKASGKAG